MILIELTVPSEERIAAGHERKLERYILHSSRNVGLVVLPQEHLTMTGHTVRDVLLSELGVKI